jgi:hypothetical protein
MSEFRFDPPLSVKNDFTIATLDDALGFARSYATPRLPKTRESVLFWLERANDRDLQEKAADMFRSWTNLEDIVAK